MFLRFALSIGGMTVLAVLAAAQPSWAQNPAPSAPPSAATKPADAAPSAPAPTAPAVPAPTASAAPREPFGEDTNLTAQPIVYLKGTGTWDKAFATITGAFKQLKAYVDKQGLKQDGPVMTIFTSTDDTGFDFEAAIPVAEPPKNPPKGAIAVGTSPQGHALKFVHHGSYDALDDTYEAITNYLDAKRLDAKDMFIEQYVTDPLTANEDHLVVNVYVLVK